MKNKIILAATCLQIIGCASLKYPGWERVSIEQSVFNKPCKYVYEEQCSNGSIGCVDWYKKRATTYNANTVVIETDKQAANYFYCAPGLPPFLDSPEAAWTVRNIYNPGATRMDLDKSYDECAYEAHKAVLDTGRPAPTRTYIPTSNYYVNSAQLSAIHMDNINQSLHKQRLAVEGINLKYECLKAKGFVFNRSAGKKDYDDIKKFCPGIDNAKEPCLIPSQ
jgi:hypothetical protein